MTFRIKLRRDTAAAWTSANPILAAGEPGLETDTGKIKYGDGVTAWNSLSHAGGDTLNDEGGVTVTAGSTKYWVAAQRRENQDTFGRGLRYDSEGNVYTLTKTYDGDDNFSVITKYSTTGALLWQHSIDQSDPTALAVDSNDCAYIALENNNNAHLIKFDTDGTIAWKQSYNAGSWQGEAFIEERTDTRLVMTLNRNDSGPGQILVLDINTDNGEVVTQKVISNSGDDVWAAGIDTDSNGNVFVTGRYYDPGSDKWKMHVEKLDTNLDRVWSKSIETPNNYNMDAGDCASDSQGNVYAVGFYEVDLNNYEGNGSQRAGILIKLNSSGVTQWTRRLGPGPCGTSVTGLTVTDIGDVYLITTTLEYKRDDKQLNEFNQMAQGTSRMILARYNTAGAVIWQRYVDAKHVWESNDDFRGQTIDVHNDKLILDFYGISSNDIPWNFSGTDDNEDDYFLVQLPADGTELEIGDLAFKASRIPGRFVTHETSTSPTVNEVLESTITVSTSSLVLDDAARIANALVKSETYDYVFGADGTLTIPNDGDIKLTQSQIGWLGVIGGSVNYDQNTWGRAVVADSQGNMYAVGEDDNYGAPVVVKISPEGYRLWSVAIRDNNNGDNGRANGISLNPETGNVVVVCEMYGNYTYGAVITIDQDTGRVLSNVEYKDPSNDVYLNDITFRSNGAWVIGGSRNGQYGAEQPVTAQTGSTNQKIVVLRSEVTGTVQSYWQIGGTGFNNYEQIVAIEQYSNLSGSVDVGSGTVNIDVVCDGAGPYTYGAVTVNQGGTGYKVGHKIFYIGTMIPGGASPGNNLVLTVTAVDGSGAITSATAAGDAPSNGTITGLQGGVNHQIGTGFSLSYYNGPTTTSNYDNSNYGVSNYGSGYVIGDVIRFAGTDLSGTSPANDLIFTVTNVGGSGDATSWAISGTAQSTYWNIITGTNVDFSQSGSWSLTYPLSRENILLTADWFRTYGTNTGDNTDRTYAIALDSSDNIVTATQGYGDVTGNNDNDDLAVVYKFNSNGLIQWARQLNEKSYWCRAMSVATIGTDIYATHYSGDNGETVITKLNTDGAIQWQRITDSSDDSVVADAGDGNILIAIEAYNGDIGDNAYKVIKMTPAGETVYKRWLYATTDSDSNFKNGRSMTVVNGDMYITGYYYANDYDSWFVGRLPADGSGTGEYAQFRYTDVNAQDGNYNYPSLYGVNYDINEVVLADGYAGATQVEPYVNATDPGFSTEGDYYVDSYYPDYNYEDIVDTDGGRIVFADGTTQDTSATDIPQRIYTGQRYTLGMRDRGHHIYCSNQDDNIIIPYDARVPFPIGTTITIVNDTGGTVYIYTEGGGTSVMLAGDGYYSGFAMDNYGIATLLKIGREKWVISGNVGSD